MRPFPSAALSSLSLTAAIRLALGLSVRQLARYLGVSKGFVGQLDGGYRPVPPALLPRLLPLSRLLPPPDGTGPPLPPPAPTYDAQAPLPPPELLVQPAGDSAPAPLRRRQREVRLQLLTQGQLLARQQQRMSTLAHRHRGLALLQAAPPPPEPAEAAHYSRWLSELAEDLAYATPDPATEQTALALLAARVAGLRAELVALLALDAQPGMAPEGRY